MVLGVDIIKPRRKNKVKVETIREQLEKYSLHKKDYLMPISEEEVEQSDSIKEKFRE